MEFYYFGLFYFECSFGFEDGFVFFVDVGFDVGMFFFDVFFDVGEGIVVEFIDFIFVVFLFIVFVIMRGGDF